MARGKKLPVKKSKTYEADIVVRYTVPKIRAYSREEAEQAAIEMFWERVDNEDMSPLPAGVVLRRME